MEKYDDKELENVAGGVDESEWFRGKVQEGESLAELFKRYNIIYTNENAVKVMKKNGMNTIFDIENFYGRFIWLCK